MWSSDNVSSGTFHKTPWRPGYVYREQGWTTVGDWGGGGTAWGWGDYRDQKNQGIQMDNSRRLGETAMDRGNYGDYGDQGIYMGNKGGQQWETGGDSEGLGRVQRPRYIVYIWSKGYITQGDWERSKIVLIN